MSDLISCACGCGTQLESRDSRNRPRRFISGHNSWKYKEATVRPCTTCGEAKPFSDFFKKATRCKACTTPYMRQYYLAHRERILTRSITWNADNADRKRAFNRMRRVGLGPLYVRKTTEWRKKNPDKRKAHYTNREARKRGNGGSFTGDDWTALKERYGNVCLACGAATKLQPDHVIPLALGGSNGIENIQPLCGPCNFRKHVKTTDYRPQHLERVAQGS